MQKDKLLEEVRKALLNKFISIVALFIMGILFIAKPAASLTVFTRLVGIVLLVCGLVLLISNFISSEKSPFMYVIITCGAIVASLGIWFLINPSWIASIINIFFGILILVNGLINLMESLRYDRESSTFKNVMLVLSGIVSILGLIVIINPWGTAKLVVRIIGIIMLYNAIINIFMMIKLSGVSKEVENAPNRERKTEVIDGEILDEKEN